MNRRRIGQFYGIVIDSPWGPLTNLRFADDVLLIAASKQDVAKMLCDLQREASNYGLAIHRGKNENIVIQSRPAS